MENVETKVVKIQTVVCDKAQLEEMKAIDYWRTGDVVTRGVNTWELKGSARTTDGDYIDVIFQCSDYYPKAIRTMPVVKRVETVKDKNNKFNKRR